MSRTNAAFSSATQHAMPPEFGKSGERSVLVAHFVHYYIHFTHLNPKHPREFRFRKKSRIKIEFMLVTALSFRVSHKIIGGIKASPQ